MYALLTLDLQTSDSSKRKVFDEEMVKLQWSKCPNVSTAWRASFKGEPSTDAMLRATKKDVAAAADAAKIRTYSAVVHFGHEEPLTFP